MIVATIQHTGCAKLRYVASNVLFVEQPDTLHIVIEGDQSDAIQAARCDFAGDTACSSGRDDYSVTFTLEDTQSPAWSKQHILERVEVFI